MKDNIFDKNDQDSEESEDFDYSDSEHEDLDEDLHEDGFSKKEVLHEKTDEKILKR